MAKETKNGYTKKYIALARRYNDMIIRCYDTKHRLYKHYGAIGVTVCDEWLDANTGLISYIDWILSQKTYEEMDKLQIDKDILSNKLGIHPAIYSPSTCLILTASENAQARKLLKSTNTSGYKGVSSNHGKWYACCTLHGVFKNLGTWDTKLEAAKAYDYYNILNNSYSTLNGVLDPEETVDGISINGFLNPSYSSKYYGVSYDKSRNKWAAQVKFNGKKKSLGRFDQESDAANAVKQFCIEHNYNLHKLNTGEVYDSIKN